MRFGIGTPNAIAGATGPVLIEWARRAEARGFSSLVSRDRNVWESHEPLTVLAASAAVTTTIELVTNAIVAPTRDAVLLAKMAATVDQLSGGRLLLGLGVGEREDDFTVTGTSFRGRGARWDEDLETMHAAWRGEHVRGSDRAVTATPVRSDRVPIIIGGTVPHRVISRVLRWGVGWTLSGMHPSTYAETQSRLRAAWTEAGRTEPLRICAVMGYALGPKAVELTRVFQGAYLSYAGSQRERRPPTPTSAEDIQERVTLYRDHGITDLWFTPLIAELDQIEYLAEALGL